MAAAVADPLWLLARQWQLLELKGENAGAPIRTDVTYEVAEIGQIALGDQPFAAIGPTPVEVLVEREGVHWDWRMRVRAGQQFERLVRAHEANADVLIRDARAMCPITKPAEDSDEWIDLDHAARRFVSAMAGRAIDGEALLPLIEHTSLPVSSVTANSMLEWYRSFGLQVDTRVSPAWQTERLDYEFRLRARPNASGSLRAPSYRNGSIDWHSFVADGSPARGFAPQPATHPTPVHVTYAGQPKRRWWEFEDRAVNFGALDTAKTDLAKLILTEFALVQGDDWFLVPLAAAPNTLVRLREVRVHDCFGVSTVIHRAQESVDDPLRAWQAYSLSSAGTDFLYVPPSTGVREESPALEEVQFARDEDANAVFAIEHIVPNQVGEPARGFAAHLETQRRWAEHLERLRVQTGEPTPPSEPVPEPGTAERPPIRYVLSTRVPRNWIPFVAADASATGIPQRSVKLCRAEIVSTEPADARQPIRALSRLLNAAGGRVDYVNEEAVGRAGVRVELRRQRMRSATGETYVWLGRTVRAGSGQARSGLRFDATRDRSTNA